MKGRKETETMRHFSWIYDSWFL